MTEIEQFISKLNKITNLSHFKNVLQFLADNEKEGWEKWLQIEISSYLNESDYTIKIESPYSRDKRKSYRGKNLIDIEYRRPNTSINSCVAVELKVRRDASCCISEIINDLVGVSHITEKAWKFRSVVGCGFYTLISRKEKNSKYVDFINEAKKISPNQLTFDIKKIGEWERLVIAWESNVIDNKVSRSNYFKSLNKLSELAETHSVYF